MTNLTAAGPAERLRIPVGLAIAGLLLELFGGAWDISWHVDEGRESFWSPPHLALYAGIILVMAAIFHAISRAGGARAARRYPALLAVVGATVFQLSSAPFDELWHRMYGVDITVWSPPHLVLILGGAATAVALATLALSIRPERIDRLMAIVLFAIALAGVSAVYAEWEYPHIPRSHESQRRPIWSYPLVVTVSTGAVLVAASRSLGPGGALFSATGAVAIKLLILAALIGRDSPPLPPPFYMAPALAIETVALAFSKIGRRRGVLASLAGGLLAAAMYLIAEPEWRSIVPTWPRLLPALTAFWPVVLAGGVIGGLTGHLISVVFDRTTAAGRVDEMPETALVLEPSSASS